jgi:hypothetical protein
LFEERGNAILDSGINGLVTAASIKVQVKIVTYGKTHLRGVLHSVFLDAPYEFTSHMQMIEKMEEIFDTKDFPEAFMSARSFGVARQSTKIHEVSGYEYMKDMVSTGVPFEHGDSRSTFEITVKFRQNATWQGQILWAEKNLKQNFRSVLEMLKLMDEALADGSEMSDSITWESD